LAGTGEARRGRAGEATRRASWLGFAWSGKARQSRIGRVWRGVTRSGRRGSVWAGGMRYVVARLGRQGPACSGTVWPSLVGIGWARQARRGAALRGEACVGMATQARRVSPGRDRRGGARQAWIGANWLGPARCVLAWQAGIVVGWLRFGEASCGLAGAARTGRVGLVAAGFGVVWQARRGWTGLGEVWPGR
jgi:hypothetical protein